MQSNHLGRREFITLVGGAVAAWPLAARAQQPTKLPTIGFLGANTAVAQSQWTAAFVQRLREVGWIEGRTVAIEYRWLEGRTERAPEMVAEFVRLKVDVIVTQRQFLLAVFQFPFRRAEGKCGAHMIPASLREARRGGRDI